MRYTRREFVVGLVETAAAAAFIGVMPGSAEAYLLGKWWLACPYSDCDRIDQVTGGTKQHPCSKCGR